MSFFCGCSTNLVMLIFSAITALLFLAVATARPDQSSLLEQASREELVNMAGYGEEKLSTVIVTGTILCQHHDLHAQAQAHYSHAWPVPGVTVGIKCHTKEMARGKSCWTRGVTDEYGDFIMDLPSHLHATPNLDRVCSVKVIKVPNDSLCRPTYVGKHSRIKLSSIGNGIRTYSTATVNLLHLESKPSHDHVATTSSNGEM